jgi:acyl-CoA carboxylase subunit beta
MRTALNWLNAILDSGWSESDAGLGANNPLSFPGYKTDAESVITASGAIEAMPVEAISFDFSLLGGSMGVAAGEKIARAFERGAERRAAVVALTASGGARMQEGMLALAQMAKTMVARTALQRARLPFVAYLGDPTTGGVYASFGSQADVLWAEPGATIGFAGPRVAAAAGEALPPGSHTAEFSLERGLIDDIVAPDDLRARLVHVLDLTMGRDEPEEQTMPSEPAPAPDRDAWDDVTLARHDKRPTGVGFARMICGEIEELRGDRAGVDDRALVCGLARLAGRRIAVIALDRGRPRPPAYRKAYRLARFAANLGLPLVTFIDTPGADPSSSSEAAGIARTIATAFRTTMDHPAPTVAVVTGEGGSGGALALAVCDRVLVCEHAFFSVIAPEGAAAILKRNDVEQVAADLKLRASDLLRFGLADRIVPEPGTGAHTQPEAAAAFIKAAIAATLAELPAHPDVEARRARWRSAGNEFLLS